MVTDDDDRNEAEDPNRESIVIATRVSPSRKTRLRMYIALAILVLCGTIAGVVYAEVKPPPSPPPPPALPFTPKPPSMSPTQESGPPTYTIMSQLGQILIEEESDFTSNATTTKGPRGERYFGWCVDLSLNGARLAVTSPFLNAVYVYEMVDGNWQRMANIVETDLWIILLCQEMGPPWPLACLPMMTLLLMVERFKFIMKRTTERLRKRVKQSMG
jgi:hypothetical protein